MLSRAVATYYYDNNNHGMYNLSIHSNKRKTICKDLGVIKKSNKPMMRRAKLSFYQSFVLFEL